MAEVEQEAAGAAGAAGAALGDEAEELVFAVSCQDDNFILFEMDEGLLGELLASGRETDFVIRGDDTAEAMLCTAGKTFQVRKVESSNTNLLVCPGVKRRRGGHAEEAGERPARRTDGPPHYCGL